MSRRRETWVLENCGHLRSALSFFEFSTLYPYQIQRALDDEPHYVFQSTTSKGIDDCELPWILIQEKRFPFVIVMIRCAPSKVVYSFVLIGSVRRGSIRTHYMLTLVDILQG